MHRGGGHVVDMEELAPRRAAAPEEHSGGAGGVERAALRQVADGLGDVTGNGAINLLVGADGGGIALHRQGGEVILADHRRDDMAVLEVVVVPRPVEIGGHQRAVACAVLAVVGLAQLDAGDLGHRIGLVGGLEHAGEQLPLVHGLRGVFGIDAGTAEKEQILDPGTVGGIDDVDFDLQVDGDELGGIAVVGVDAADLGGGQHHTVNAFGGEELAYRPLVGEIELVMAPGHHVAAAEGLQMAHDGRADHAAMAGDVDALARVERTADIGIGHGSTPTRDG